MKKMMLVTGFAAIAVSSPAYALQNQITPLPISDLQCNVSRGSPTYSFVANWGALIDASSKANPKPLLINPQTGKPWPRYKVALRAPAGNLPCTVPNNGMVDCGGAARCSILVTCPVVRSTGTSVYVVGEGIASSSVPTIGGRKPEGCK